MYRWFSIFELNMRKKLLLFFFLLITVNSFVLALNCTSGSGTYASWAATPWTCTPGPTAGPPGCSDVIYIAGTIRMSADVDFSACPAPMTIVITSTGTLDFNTNGVRFRLPDGSGIIIQTGGRIIKTFAGGGSSTLISEGTGGGATNLWTAGTGTVTGPTTLGTPPLPIELLTFSAEPNGENVAVKWVTATESNNDYFTVEKTKDFVNFETVSILDGAGNSIAAINYETVDNSPFNGVSYYRLKQTDYNGDFTYFPYVGVEFKSNMEFSFDVYPNPNSGENINLNLRSTEDLEVLVVVYDMTGKESYSRIIVTSTQGENVYAIDPNQKLSKGVYLVTATSNQSIYSKRLVVQ